MYDIIARFLCLTLRDQEVVAQKMKEDEIRHADEAQHAGGKPLPESIKQGMRLMSKVMTTTAYRI